MLLINVIISCHMTTVQYITVLHTIKLLKQLNTGYVLGCTCLKKKKNSKIVELELGERERGEAYVSSLHELQEKRGLPPTEN